MEKFTIPTVDISPYLENPDSSAAKAVVSEIRSACETSGFFQIINHGIPRTIQDGVLQCAKDFFALTQEEKMKCAAEKPGRGYEVIGKQTLQPGAKPDLKEGYFVGPEHNDKPPYRDFWYPNVWPEGTTLSPTKFKYPLLEYRQRLCELSEKVMQILAEGLPQGDRNLFASFSRNPLATVRLLHYPPQQELSDTLQFGAGSHTDFGAITLLLQDNAGGLQVLLHSVEPNEWVDVPPNPDAYVVNVGDMLQMWTNGRYRSNFHRVINKSGGQRYSVPFFFDGNLDYVLQPLDKEPVLGQGTTVASFMKQKYDAVFL